MLSVRTDIAPAINPRLTRGVQLPFEIIPLDQTPDGSQLRAPDIQTWIDPPIHQTAILGPFALFPLLHC